MTTRQDQRRQLVRDQVRERLEQADALRAAGKRDEADQIEIELGKKEPPVVDPMVEQVRQLFHDHKPREVYDFVKSGSITRPQWVQITKSLTPSEVDMLTEVGEFVDPQDMVKGAGLA